MKMIEYLPLHNSPPNSYVIIRNLLLLLKDGKTVLLQTFAT